MFVDVNLCYGKVSLGSSVIKFEQRFPVESIAQDIRLQFEFCP